MFFVTIKIMRHSFVGSVKETSVLTVATVATGATVATVATKFSTCYKASAI